MKTILIVDDDKDVRSMMRYILLANKYKVLEAENGSSALAIAIRRQPDVVISDVMMDNMNGFMLCELLRKDPATQKIPVILVTGAADHAGAWGAVEGVSYLRKPVSVNELLLAVRSCF